MNKVSALKLVVLSLTLGLVVAAPSSGALFPRIDLKIVDERGNPIERAAIEAGCTGRNADRSGLTDTNGVFSYTERIKGVFGCEVRKDGYYFTRGELWTGPSSAGDTPPTNTYTIVLKKITDPVPMINRRVEARLKWFDRPVGYDLESGDWVAPFGRGTHADLSITGRSRGTSFADYECYVTIAATNSGDGFLEPAGPPQGTMFLESALESPQSAPDIGYLSSVQMYKKTSPGKSSEVSPRYPPHYIVKVRSEKDKAGRTVVANYGFIYDGFDFYAAVHYPYIKIKFAYYFNPDSNSRSLEPQELSKPK
jgi:hypothetical protein